MSLNALKLPGPVVAGLYGKNLVETGTGKLPGQTVALQNETPGTAGTLPAAEKFPFLGENRKNILVTVSNDNVKFLPDDELSFLTNMLTACKLSLADVAIVNLSKTAAHSYKEITDQLNSSIILLFGTEPSLLNLPLSFPHFQVQTFNTYTFLFTPSLNELQNDKVLKSKLWVCLRRIFNI